MKNLQVVWRRPAVDDKLKQAFPDLSVGSYLRSTPIMIDGVLYTQDAHGFVSAFDPGSGATIWQQEPFARTVEEVRGQSTRGVDYWRGGSDQRILVVRGEYLYALNAKTGKIYPDFGDKGRASLHFDENQPLAGRFSDSTGPIVVGNVVVVTGNTAGAGDGGPKKEAAREDVRGFDVKTGKLLWTFHVVPQEGEFGNDTWGNESWKVAGDLGSWNPMTADEQLGYVYIPLSAPTASSYGGWRPGANLYSESLVALDAKTGKRVWHYQMIHHDLWEYDNVGPATLGDITVNGRRIKAVMQPNKNGFLYVLDRTTGEPVWPIEERPVGRSNVPGEQASPTQPIPTKPPPFDRQGVTEDDLIDFTPALREAALEVVKPYVLGPLYSPPSLIVEGGTRGTLTIPGAWGARQLAYGRVRSRDGDVLRGLADAARSSVGEQHSRKCRGDDGVRRRWRGRRWRWGWGRRPRRPATDTSWRGRRARSSSTGTAACEAALWPDYRVQPSQRQHRVGRRQRRRSAQSSAAEGSQSAATRRPEPAGPAAHQNTSLPRRRKQRGDWNAAGGLGMGKEVPRLRQGDGQGDRGSRSSVGHDGRADDLHAQRQAVHRHPDRSEGSSGGVRRSRLDGYQTDDRRRPVAKAFERFPLCVVSGFSRTVTGPPEGGHYVQM